MIFHGRGLSRETLICAFRHGLAGRADGELATHHWAKSVTDLIYFSRSNAQAFARHNASVRNFSVAAMFEISINDLDPKCLLPDEDFLCLYALDGRIDEPWHELPRDTPRPKLNPRRYQAFTQQSLLELGNVAFDGKIPFDAVQRIALFPLIDALDGWITYAEDFDLRSVHRVRRFQEALQRFRFDGSDVDPSILESLCPAGPSEEVIAQFSSDLSKARIRRNRSDVVKRPAEGWDLRTLCDWFSAFQTRISQSQESNSEIGQQLAKDAEHFS